MIPDERENIVAASVGVLPFIQAERSPRFAGRRSWADNPCMAADGSMIGTLAGARQFPRSRFPEWLVLAGLLLLAASLRFDGLGRQSLWADEGNSWGMAVRPLAAIGAAVSADIHPPLYYYLLNLWSQAFGTSEAGLRSFSALVGCLLVVVTYYWARRLAGLGAALAAGLLAAASPFALYYSQEARAYALVALLGAASSLAFGAFWQARAGGRDGRAAAVAYVLASAALLWSHYLAILVLLLHNIFALLLLLSLDRRGRLWPAARTWALLQVAVLALYSPWLPTMLRRAGDWPAISARESLAFYLRETARLYTLGVASRGLNSWAWLALAPALPAALPAALAWRRLRPGLLGALVLAYALWPALGLWLLSLLRPAYRAKFLLLGLPAYHVLAGAGVIWLGRLVARLSRTTVLGMVAGLLAFAPAVVTSTAGLRSYYDDPSFYRDDYRGLARFLESAAGPADAIILNAPGQVEVFSYYYRGQATLYPLPRQRPIERGQIEAELSEVARRHERAFAVLWATAESDPLSYIGTWLDLNAYKARDTWYGNVRLVAYEMPRAALERRQAAAQFGDSIMLDYYSFGLAPVTPGAALPIEFTWRALAPLEARYKVFVQALDQQSNIIGQRDCEPVSGHRPTDTWQTGETVRDRQALPVSLGTPPGAYLVIAGLYDRATGARLLLPDGSDRLVLGQMLVGGAPRPVDDEALRPLVRANIAFGPLRLIGWDSGRLGEAPGRSFTAMAGQPLSVVLYWRVLEADSVELALSLESGGHSLPLGTQAVMQGVVPPERWQVGQVLRDPHLLFLPVDLPVGRYILSLKVATTGGGGQVDLASVIIS